MRSGNEEAASENRPTNQAGVDLAIIFEADCNPSMSSGEIVRKTPSTG